MALHVKVVTGPRVLSEFWPAAWDMGIVTDDGEHVVLTGDRDLALSLQRVSGLQRVSAPTSAKNRVHLDLSTKDRAAVGRLLGVGLSVDEVLGMACKVLAGPDGNICCVGAEG